MKPIKSIDNLFSVFLGMLTIINIFSLMLAQFVPPMALKHFLILILLFIMLVTLLILSNKKIKFPSAVLGTSVILYLLLFISFRKIRDYFPSPQTEGNEVVGFANYFNYPIYFDYFLFLVIIIIPFLSYFLIKRFLNNAY